MVLTFPAVLIVEPVKFTAPSATISATALISKTPLPAFIVTVPPLVVVTVPKVVMPFAADKLTEPFAIMFPPSLMTSPSLIVTDWALVDIVTLPLTVVIAPVVTIPWAAVSVTVPFELMSAPDEIVKAPPPAIPLAFKLTVPPGGPSVFTFLFKLIVFAVTLNPAAAEYV